MKTAGTVVFGLLALVTAAFIVQGGATPEILGHALVLLGICFIGYKACERGALWIAMGVVSWAAALVWIPVVPLAAFYLAERLTRPKLAHGVPSRER